ARLRLVSCGISGTVSGEQTQEASMRATWATMMAGLLASGAVLARDKVQDERDIRAAEAALCHAFEIGDAGELKKFLDPTFTLTNSRGEVTDYQANLAEVASR